MVRRYFGKAIIRSRMMLEKFFNSILMILILAHIRNEAHRKRRVVARKKGRKVVNRKMKRSIKAYAKKRFGKTSYWPNLAFYTEVTGEFREGWIPYDYFRFSLLPKLNPKPAVFMDFKTFDYQLFSDFAVKPLYLFVSGMYYDADLNFVDPDQIRSVLAGNEEEIVVKKESGWGGMQVQIMTASSFNPDQLNGGADYVIQPYVKQYKALNDLYPHSVNTLRVNTFLQKDGSVRILSVTLRFGGDGDRVDNISSGGNPLFFDLNGKPYSYTLDPYYFTKMSDRHKNTGFRFADIEIPMFQDVLEKCREAHKKVPYVRLVAWDTCVDHRGEPKLIEWNIDNPEFSSQEMLFGPFWTNDSEFI